MGFCTEPREGAALFRLSGVAPYRIASVAMAPEGAFGTDAGRAVYQHSLQSEASFVCWSLGMPELEVHV